MATTTYVFSLSANVRVEAVDNGVDYTLNFYNDTTNNLIASLTRVQVDRLSIVLSDFFKIRSTATLRSATTV
jgi:hypothetical protein